MGLIAQNYSRNWCGFVINIFVSKAIKTKRRVSSITKRFILSGDQFASNVKNNIQGKKFIFQESYKKTNIFNIATSFLTQKDL